MTSLQLCCRFGRLNLQRLLSLGNHLSGEHLGTFLRLPAPAGAHSHTKNRLQPAERERLRADEKRLAALLPALMLLKQLLSGQQHD